ncbi:unnamed protein product, partial [Musa acuminata subsp. burmannicoides]
VKLHIQSAIKVSVFPLYHQTPSHLCLEVSFVMYKLILFFLEQKVGVALICSSSLVDGICWACYHHHTKAPHSYVGAAVLDLGWICNLYMGMLAVFCTHSINIHAGLNGLEAEQTVVISAAVLIHNIMQIGKSSDPEYQQAHAFSIYLVLCLLTTSLALLSYNWYPSSDSVGDTYTLLEWLWLYFLAIHSATLLLFFLPQVLNFLYSCPQIFKITPCPRHPLPRFDPQTGLLTGTKDGNLLYGRCTENILCIILLIFQAFSCLLCFCLRHVLAGWYKRGVTANSVSMQDREQGLKHMNELVAARQKAEEVHVAEAKRNHQAATIAQQADDIRESSRTVSSFFFGRRCLDKIYNITAFSLAKTFF